MLLGPLSGWNFVYYYLKEIENYTVSPDQAKEISTRFKDSVNKLNKKNSPEKLLLEIAEGFNLSKTVIPEKQRKRRLEDLSS